MNSISDEHHVGASAPPSTSTHSDRSLTQCWSGWLAPITHNSVNTHTDHPKTPPTDSLHLSGVCLWAFIYSPHSLSWCIIYSLTVKVSGDDVNVSEWGYQNGDYMERNSVYKPWMLSESSLEKISAWLSTPLHLNEFVFLQKANSSGKKITVDLTCNALSPLWFMLFWSSGCQAKGDLVGWQSSLTTE